MKEKIQLDIGSVIDWHGEKFKVVIDGEDDWCDTCAFKGRCNDDVPFICSGTRRRDGNNIHFEKIGGAK